MQEVSISSLDNRIHLIDGYDLGIARRTGTYVIDDEHLTLIETGPSPSVPYIKSGLDSLGFSLEQVKFIIVTHIHLDHAGGVGLFLQECPNATVVVHPKGARHLADPRKLIAGAQAVYQDSFNDLFAPVLAVPEDRLEVKEEGETLRIGAQSELRFLDTPGHARHHLSIYDPVSHGMFTGDTVGVHYKPLMDDGIGFFLPSTSPNHFDPDAMRRSVERIRDWKLDSIYFGHFGMTKNVDVALDQVEEWLDVFMKAGKQVFSEKKGHEELAARLRTHVEDYLRTLQVNDNHEVYTFINLDMHVCAIGIMDYLKKVQV
ncbi:MBL fold metallo-hydrolase [Aquibacillus sp. 3ASR75-11]|uniref:MBL fold metallo-hydrolase n=1 Tax=Terrihalobacillus insolitus TaxID=2950438 RepID=A0A9X4AQA8_9BACI|nr:MBL fold metallo-hydrolase [Terrihalobacillus insolitus]MDC3414513.1 MBL fold metallo-hydrolase [Terrihalobacillus insolitus]MDC3426340.1 MBL fold metallo-hydrolase [Terrihalobacillus insolitus]